jgi:hypothetical protein
MKGISIILLLGILLFLNCPTVLNAEESSDVVVLTDANFDQLTATGSWMLEFYGQILHTYVHSSTFNHSCIHFIFSISLLCSLHEADISDVLIFLFPNRKSMCVCAAPWCGQLHLLTYISTRNNASL